MITLLMRLIDAFRGLEVVYAMTFGGPGLSTELFSLHIYKTAPSSPSAWAIRLRCRSCLLVVTTALSVLLLMASNPMRRRGDREPRSLDAPSRTTMRPACVLAVR